MPLRWVQDGPNQWRGLAGDTFATLYQPPSGTAWRVRIVGCPFMAGSLMTLGEAQAVAEQARAAQQQSERATGLHAQHPPSGVPETHSPLATGFKRAMKGRNALVRAERDVQEAEERLARQQRTVTELELKGDVQETEMARKFLATCQRSLETQRTRLRLERQKRGLAP